MSDELDRCRRVLHSVAPDHNLHRVGQHSPPHFGYEPWGTGLRVRLRHVRLATFDTDLLTRLVLAAHRERVRVEISPNNMSTIEVTVHPRTADGAMHERHPDLADLFAGCDERPRRSTDKEVAVHE